MYAVHVVLWPTNRLFSPDFGHSLAEGPSFPLKSTPFSLGSLFIPAVCIIPSSCPGPRQRVGLLALLPELLVPVANSSHSRPPHRAQHVSKFILQTTTAASTLARSSSTKRKIHKKYSQRGWIPLVVDKAGNYIGVDLNPGEGGSVGQVIVFGRDFDTKVVLWRGDGPGGWAKWLSSFVDELESGEGFELGQGNSESEGSEDGLGYEAYFFDGNGRGQGDGGGEAGPGGIRLAGEYRGWSPLEAWADRSVRKWCEAGLQRDVSSPVEKGKAPEKRGLGVLNLDESAAVVPIPIFGEELVEEPTALANVTNVTSRPVLPAISVTKPPVPLPVDLPTVSDVVTVVPLPSPPDSQRSSVDVDLEAGRSIGMRQLSGDGIVPGKSPAMQPAPASHTIDLHIPDIAPVEEAATSAPLEDVTDLLADSIPLEAVAPMSPSTPTKPEPEPTTEEISEPAESSSPPRPSEEEVPADTTIRLVGGGGLSGSVDMVPPVDKVDDVALAEVTSVTSAGSNDSPSKKDKKHDKNKTSLSSLKKFGANIAGGKRKKDSVSTNSMKETL